MKRLCAIFLVLAFLIVLLFPVVPCLEVRSRTGRLLFSRPVHLHERVTLNYIHSVARRPVDEIWEVSPREMLVLRETVYDSFGAGLPTEAAPGEKMELKDGRLRISGMNRELPVVGLAVGRIAQHTLVFKNGTVRLADVSPPGSLVEIRVLRRPFAAAIWRSLVFKKAFAQRTPKGGSPNG